MLAQISRMSAAIGPLDTALLVLSRMLARLTFGRLKLLKYYITAQPVPAGALTPLRRGQSIVVTEGTPEQARSTPFGRPQAAIEHRLANGARHVVARKDGRLIGFQWFTLRDYPEDEVRCVFRLHPGDGCAWDFDIFVTPEARTMPVFTRLWDTVNAIFRSAGIEFTMSRINAFNQASMQAHARIGAKPVGWAVFLIAGPVQLSLFSACPWIHASFSDACAPTLAVADLVRQRKTSTRFSE